MNNDDFLWEENLSPENFSSNNGNNVIDFPETEQFVQQGNQARAHSGMSYPYKYNNLLFQQPEELALYKAAERWAIEHPNEFLGILPQIPICYFSPENKSQIGRTQPDLWIKWNGADLILEIDGGSHKEKSPAEEEKRLEIFIFNGGIVHRIDAPEQGLDEVELRNWADKAFEESMRFLKRCMDGRSQRW